MIFRICEKNEQILYQRDLVCLQIENQKDSDFQTTFDAAYYDLMGRMWHLGAVKIGMKGMEYGDISEHLPIEFAALPEMYFSLGQDESYYEQIKDLGKFLGDRIRHELLRAMRDVAYDLRIFRSSLDEPVMTQSLLANIVADDIAEYKHKKAVAKVEGQFNRMAELGGDRLTKYHFTYTAKDPDEEGINPAVLEFRVNPESNPPTNVHAIIGSNGCGKTYLMHHMVKCLQDRTGSYGKFEYHGEPEEIREFANVVCVAFSPFDSFPEPVMEKGDLPATFVGINEQILMSQNDLGKDLEEKHDSESQLLKAIAGQFWQYLRHCLITRRRQQLWKDAVAILKPNFEQDRIFNEIIQFMDELDEYPDEAAILRGEEQIMNLFRPLSSGHKVVLLTITSCVAEIEERSILFLDEPENHLHPPLLSALIRALSELLKKKNGVAIVSTHSPVVLQEMPRTCVSVLEWDGDETQVRSLDVETFGATVGLLTQKVFGLKSRQSGFYQLLKQAVEKYGSYESVTEAFKDQLGDQADILLHMLLMLNERKGK